MVENYDYYKFIIIGSTGVGKTCIMEQFVNGKFNPTTLSTTGVEFSMVKGLELPSLNRKVDIQIWDTAGQERFRSISRAYFRNAMGVLLVFSVVDKQSFDDISSWLSDARSLCCQDAQILLVGNKTDLPNRVVSTSEAEAFASENKIPYVETSAKNNQSVREAFIRVANDVVNIVKEANESESKNNKLKTRPDPPKKKECC